jgi:hypothetical protein
MRIFLPPQNILIHDVNSEYVVHAMKKIDAILSIQISKGLLDYYFPEEAATTKKKRNRRIFQQFYLARRPPTVLLIYYVEGTNCMSSVVRNQPSSLIGCAKKRIPSMSNNYRHGLQPPQR